MFAVGDAVKLQHRNAAVARERDGALEIFQRPSRAGVTGRGNEQRVIGAGLIGDAPTDGVGHLGLPTATGETDTRLL